MQPQKENQLFIFEDDEEIVERSVKHDKSQAQNYEKMQTIQLQEQSEQAREREDNYEQMVSPNFNSLPPHLKGHQKITAAAVPQQQKLKNQPDFVFSEQNAYSFRKNQLEKKPQAKHQQIQNQLEIISDFASQLSKNEALVQPPEENTSGLSRNNSKSRRSKTKIKYQNINDQSSISSQKFEEKHLHFKEPQKVVPNLLNQQPNKNNDTEYHKTEDHLRHDKHDHAEIIESMNAINRSKRNDKCLPPINPPKQGQIFINTSGILQNQSSMIALKTKQEQNKLSMTNMSSLTQMLHTNQNEKIKKMSEKVVPLGKTFKCTFQRQKKCCHQPVYSFHYKGEKLILNSKKQRCHVNSCYSISAQQNNFDQEGQNFSGYLRGNFFGTIFNLYQKSQDIEELVCTVCYQTQFSCSSAFRKIQVFVKNDTFPLQSFFRGNNQSDLNLKQLYYLGQNAKQKKIFKLISKQPELNEQTGIYSMNFKGKCKMASVKNMILISQEEPKRYVLLFCKTDNNSFYTQISYPLSPLTAMGPILSGFDFKLFCQ